MKFGKTETASNVELLDFMDKEHLEPCEYGHLMCSDVEGGYCFDEAEIILIEAGILPERDY